MFKLAVPFVIAIFPFVAPSFGMLGYHWVGLFSRNSFGLMLTFVAHLVPLFLTGDFIFTLTFIFACTYTWQCSGG